MSEIPVISIGETRVTLFALLAGLFFLAAAAAVTVRLRRREWKTGPAVLFCLAAGLLGLALGRGLFFVIRSEYFLDPMGQSVGLAPLFDFNLGGVTVVGVIPGVFLGGWIVCRAFGKNTAETFDAAKGLAVSAANFPDPAFRSYVEQFCDQDGDLVLTAEEIADVTRMDVRGKGISSLEGIEAFSSLVTLNCSDNNLRELNVSDLPRLEQLYCQENYRAGEKGQEQTGLALLVPSGALKELWCYNNNLTGEALNLALCPELRLKVSVGVGHDL